MRRERRGVLGAVVLVGVLAATSLVAGRAAATPSSVGRSTVGPSSVTPIVSSGSHHACGLSADGQVRCWGRNQWGQLGLGDTVNRGDQPIEMGPSLASVDLGAGRSAVALSAGSQHSCAVLDNGQVKCWGYNDYGQLGLGDTAERGDQPGEMGDALPPVDLGAGRTATAVSAGDSYTCAVLDNAQLRCWGSNTSGRLGLGDTANRGDDPGEMGDALPPVDLGAGRTATAVSAGDSSACAVLDDGRLKCWGSNGSGALGLGDTANRGDGPGEMGDDLPAVDLGTGRTATAVALGLHHTCALLDDGRIKCWGENSHGRLGLGDTADRGDGPGEMGDDLPAVDLGTGRTATSVDSGYDSSSGGGHTCAALDNGQAKCWGYNDHGALGLGDRFSRGDQPFEMGDDLPAVDLGTGRTATAMAAGSTHSCALLDNGQVKCWGSNGFGQLGLGDTAARGRSPGQMGDSLPGTIELLGALAGLVTDGDGAPLAGTLVAALDTNGYGVAGGAVAAINGQFHFPVPDGTYLIYAIDPSAANEPGFFGAPTTVSVDGATTLVAGTLASRFGAVSSTVTDATTAGPVSGALALALSLDRGGEPVAAWTTDASGQVSLSGLHPGNHLLAVADPTGAHATATTPFAVAADTTTTADVILSQQTPVGTGSILLGRLTDSASSAPVAGGIVAAFRASDLAFVRAARSSSTGGYALNLAAGSYKLLFIDPSGHHVTEWFDDRAGVDPVTATAVSAPGTANATLAPTTGEMSGTISLGDRAAASAWVVAVGSSGIAGGAVTDAEGAYRITGLSPGNYRAAVVHPLSGRFEYWIDGTSYADAAVFPVTAGHDAPVDAQL
ncbi:MAG: hypothetical protein JNK12_16145 [Acidimicrobiales bacterium]|nr:hypothetical protein [Acidimicrobiales bacterium]